MKIPESDGRYFSFPVGQEKKHADYNKFILKPVQFPTRENDFIEEIIKNTNLE